MIKNMVYACLMVLLFTATPVLAQDQGGDDRQPPSAADIVAKMQAKLNLTQDQVNTITPIIEKYSTQRQTLRQSIEDGSADKSSIRGQMKQIRENENQELSQVLSADQMSQLQQMMGGQHRHNNSGGGDGGGNGGGNGGGGE